MRALFRKFNRSLLSEFRPKVDTTKGQNKTSHRTDLSRKIVWSLPLKSLHCKLRGTPKTFKRMAGLLCYAKIEMIGNFNVKWEREKG